MTYRTTITLPSGAALLLERLRSVFSGRSQAMALLLERYERVATLDAPALDGAETLALRRALDKVSAARRLDLALVLIAIDREPLRRKVAGWTAGQLLAAVHQTEMAEDRLGPAKR